VSWKEFRADERCECGHRRSAHKDKSGNKSWIENEAKDCGVGACFNPSTCRCKRFGNFYDDVLKMRKERLEK
jgi:hypothetical protein